MKIATFNINNVNKHLPNLLQWLKQSKPDIVCLQELKCEARDFPMASPFCRDDRNRLLLAGGSPAIPLIASPDTSKLQSTAC